jgi:hypothetical protein
MVGGGGNGTEGSAGAIGVIGAVWIGPGLAGEIMLMGEPGAIGGSSRAMDSLAAVVPSAPQVGQTIADGILPLTGSTSKAYFCPQSHWIFIGTIHF